MWARTFSPPTPQHRRRESNWCREKSRQLSLGNILFWFVGGSFIQILLRSGKLCYISESKLFAEYIHENVFFIYL